jgi:Transglycosylase-like domain
VTRFMAGVVAGIVITTLAGAALSLHAESDQVEAAASEAGVDPQDLRGALNSQGVRGMTTDPWVYLRSNRELPDKTLPPPAAVSPPAPASGVWDRLVQCEASGNWHASTGNGFQGGLQFTVGTWRAYGGVGSPAAASREAQIAVADRVLRGQGWQAWPACSRALGLR